MALIIFCNKNIENENQVYLTLNESDVEFFVKFL